MRNNPFLYNRRTDKTGYQQPPKGRIVHTSESPDPTDADIPKNLIPKQDRLGRPYLVEAAMRSEAEASIALDGETQSFETPTKEVIVPVSIREPGFRLDHGEQTATVVRIIRDNYVTGDHFTVADIYDGFTDNDVMRWTKTYGSNVLRTLSKAIVNVVFAEKHIRAKKMKGYDILTWRLVAKSGATAPDDLPRDDLPEVIPKPGPKVVIRREITTGRYDDDYTPVGYTLDRIKLYKDKNGTIGIFQFTPHEL
jgi:hypothetical protein